MSSHYPYCPNCHGKLEIKKGGLFKKDIIVCTKCKSSWDSIEEINEKWNKKIRLEKERKRIRKMRKNKEKEQIQKQKIIEEEIQRLSENTVDYNLIYSFIKRYNPSNNYYGDFPEIEINKLRKLLNNKGYDISVDILKKLLKGENHKQRFIDFCITIDSSNQVTIKHYIDSYLTHYWGSYKKNIELLHFLLMQKNIFNGSIEDLLILIEKEREYKILSNFEMQLKKANNIVTLNELNSMTGDEFEKYLKKIFENMGYSVINLPYVGDQGADIIIEKYGKRTVIQAKRYQERVGNSAVQQVVAAVNHYNADKGVVITTSQFTKSAKELATSNNIKLIDGRTLLELIASGNTLVI